MQPRRKRTIATVESACSQDEGDTVASNIGEGVVCPKLDESADPNLDEGADHGVAEVVVAKKKTRTSLLTIIMAFAIIGKESLYEIRSGRAFSSAAYGVLGLSLNEFGKVVFQSGDQLMLDIIKTIWEELSIRQCSSYAHWGSCSRRLRRSRAQKLKPEVSKPAA